MGPQKPVRPTFLRSLPRPQRLKQRYFLPVFSRTDKTVLSIWVDDDGSCERLSSCHSREANVNSVPQPRSHHDRDEDYEKPGQKLFHVYQDEKGKVWAIRCPRSLTPEEAQRVRRDLPEGSAREICRQYRATRILEMSGGRKRSATAETEESWRDV